MVSTLNGCLLPCFRLSTALGRAWVVFPSNVWRQMAPSRLQLAEKPSWSLESGAQSLDVTQMGLRKTLPGISSRYVRLLPGFRAGQASCFEEL